MAKTYTIDALVWHEDSKRKTHHHNSNIFGSFFLWWSEYQKSWRLDWCFEEYCDEGSVLCDSFNEGKEVATEIFMNRLLPALTEDK